MSPTVHAIVSGVALLAVSLLPQVLRAQSPGAQGSPRAGSPGIVADTSIFAPLTATPRPSDTRGANGAPGPKYWQNDTRYDLAVTLDTAADAVHGTLKLRYTNNSPDTLTVLWFQAGQPVIERFEEVVGEQKIPLKVLAGCGNRS
jgi:hypothetical protein